MALLALGINHKSAHVSLRERVAFAPEQMTEALQDLLTTAAIDEAVILSTCNRTEIFAVIGREGDSAEGDNAEGDAASQRILQWLADYHHLSLADLQACYYEHHQEQALRHMVAVSSGLDSMVLGEPQIFGQMKSAYAVAQEAGAINSQLYNVFPHVFSLAKKVRTDTAIGENPVSVAFAAVTLSRHIFSDLSNTSALLIGAGETIELVARHLFENGVGSIVVANRTLGRARELAQQFGAEAVLLSEIPEQLVNADIVISSTGSQLPILGKGAVEHALKIRKHKPMLMVDIAVPRDIEEQVGELEDVYLYTVDDLTEIVDANRQSRQQEVRKADVIINEGVCDYLQKLRSLDAVDILKAFRSQSEQIRDAELLKALKQLEKGEQAERVLEQMARSLTNKLIHSPSIEMKKASAHGRKDLISLTQQLFGLKK
ncbi:glutamyl-tRNA reductase [Dasania marina]|uniref:glutamyl-tRNA reductase n=1 Tax=Dasania marina TaxID=471499 RepID=UPI0030D753AE|tara:strand:- start:19941 stop:21233 length:1293 start_codon:yes stop_codon:yes gene_type:complete